ncbi:unnamed protein product [Ostreobium quekettii]|uniref:3-ketoacyl-CoA synthase n=1 Tax=Ostreobium quekettii TaxID=121088 RepID=A0A8S1IL24_9CHLO|nr:unnamed protein product [Ostreobium quekettii]|eukprot:evm.model.scf_763.3 EVM.evm.TU.scf_763.3   scf_763:23448-28851(+)
MAEQEQPVPEFPSQRLAKTLQASAAIAKPALAALGGALIFANAKHRIGDGSSRAAMYDNLEAFRAWTLAVDGTTLAIVLLTVTLLYLLFSKRSSSAYIVDFTVYKPPENLKCSHALFHEESVASGKFTKDSLEFQSRLIARSGLGDETYLPPGLHTTPLDITMDTARQEAEMVMFGAVGDVLERTGIKPRDVGILIVNCSLFNPTPSLSAMIINHFKMRSDIRSYNLSGMGCSAGMISVSLANELLKVYPNQYVVIVSTENITQNWYFGNERSMLIPNVLFRMGGAAIVMTNKDSERHRAKYKLNHVIRDHLGADDDAFRCVYQKPDATGEVGVELKKNLVKIAGKALQRNLSRLAPLVLPPSEMSLFAMNWIAQKVVGMKVRTYVPDFKTAFDHFCLHAGGRGVIEGLEKQLGLPKDKVEPNFQTLEWYGNTSSATVWYSLAYAETVQSVRKGDVVWQVGFGSGFKCNSAVWTALRNIDFVHEAWRHRRPGASGKKSA